MMCGPHCALIVVRIDEFLASFAFGETVKIYAQSLLTHMLARTHTHTPMVASA